MRRDTIFYQIFQQIPTLLFTLLAEPPAEASQYIFDAIEVKETGFRMDGVFMPPSPDGIIYFCEVQFQPNQLLYERMDAEIGLYAKDKHNHCWDAARYAALSSYFYKKYKGMQF